MSGSNPLNATPQKDVYFHRGAAKPYIVRFPDGLGSYMALDNTLSCQFTGPSGVMFTLSVGNGIMLGSTFGSQQSPANSVVSILPTPAQSRLITSAGDCWYELTYTSNSIPIILLFGHAIGMGGNNSGQLA